MVRIRLRRVGAKNQPSYRIVVADSHSPRDGRFIEKIGFYNPRTQPETIELDEGRALHWLSNGAKPSEAVHRLLESMGTIGRLERLHAGESLETLLEEAEAEAAARPAVDPRTRRDGEKKSPSRRAKAKAEAEASTAAVATEAVAEAEVEVEAEPEAEAEVEAEPEAEVDTEPEAEESQPDAESSEAAETE
jgi:small subunit ribosomal protein S16